MAQSISYNLTPARGQALLNFQGRIMPSKVDLYETELIEEVHSNNKKQLSIELKQKELNSDFKNLLLQGDCLSACAYLKSKDIKVDLVYIDPPFASGANYAKKIYLRNGNKEKVESDDTTIGEEIMYGDIWQKEDYLNWLYERLLAIRDIMSEKASIWIHLDWHIGSYVKVLLDEVFGEENFLNEVIWHFTSSKSPNDRYGRKHNTIFTYTKSADDHTFKLEQTPLSEFSKSKYDLVEEDGRRYKLVRGFKKYLKEEIPIDDVWDIPLENVQSKNNTGYDTQKPEALLKRILEASSEQGLIVADFFVGSGTTAKVTQNLGRKFIACDIGINAIQTTRDRLIEAGANFDILKVKDGLRLFRNPAQTEAKLFSLVEGFKTAKDLNLSNFWNGGIAGEKDSYIPVKFIGLYELLTPELLDIILENIYQLQDISDTVSTVQIIFAHKDPQVDQKYVNSAIKKAGKTTIVVNLVALDDLLSEKKDLLFTEDNADVEMTKEKQGYKVEIKRFYSPYLKIKIDEYNNRKVKKVLEGDESDEEKNKPHKNVVISEAGLELIESVQFDTTLKKNNIWVSNLDLEDKAKIKDKIKAIYHVSTNKFRMKIRNLAGDEIVINSEELQ